MKKVNLASVLFIAAMLVSFAGTVSANEKAVITEGNSHTILGDYKIAELESETVRKETIRKFEVTYSNSERPIVIYLHESPKCREYVVRSHAMEIMYVCRKSHFGARKVLAKYAQYPEQTNDMFLSNQSLEYQTKISEGDLSIDKALGLIACYYPELLQNINVLYNN
jgi:hypothetical protein